MLVFDTPRQWFALAFAVIACGYALWKGGKPERIGGAAMLLAWIVQPFAVDTNAWLNPQYAAFATDVPLLAVLVWLALRGDRWWPMWAVAFHFLGMVMAIIIVVDPRVRPLAYMTALGMWSYLTVIALVVGTWREARRRRRLVEPERG